MPSTAVLTERLDDLESRLPTIPAKVLHLQRTVTAANYDRTTAAFQAVIDSYRNIFETARTSSRTVNGQAQAAFEQLIAALTSAVKTVVGQTRAQARTVSDTTTAEVTSLVDKATDAVEDTPSSGTPYEQWTKAELVDRAKELKVVGPTRMSKNELIKALRAA